MAATDDVPATQDAAAVGKRAAREDVTAVPQPAGREAWFVIGAYAIACLSFALAGLFPLSNPDTFGHLAQGRQIVELGHVPARDTFSFWQPQPVLWHNYEWLSDWLTYRLYAAAGFGALTATKCALLALAAGLIVGLAHLLGRARGAWTCALLSVLVIPASRFRFSERPHLLTLSFVALYWIGFAYLLRAWGGASRRVDAAWIAALALLHLAWVNMHGSHLLGLVVTCAFFALSLREPDARRKLGIVLALQLGVSCISPYGPAVLFDAVDHLVDPRYREILTEWQAWQPTDPLWLMLAPVLQTLALAAVAKPLVRGGLVTRALLACACVLALAAFRSIRFVAEYLVLSTPVIALGFSQRVALPSARAFKLALGAGFVAAAAIVPWAAAQLPPYAGIAGGLRMISLPAASGAWLAQHTEHPRILATVEDSWFLMFAVPQARFLVDGRIPFYGPDHILRIRNAFSNPSDLDRVLRDYDVNVVVARHTFKPHLALLGAMAARRGWTRVSIEDRSSVFVRDDIALRGGEKPRALPLEPNYDTGWLLNADAAQERAILASLSALPAHENNLGYQGWVRAMIALKPLLRSGQANGIQPPFDPASVATLRRIERWLTRAAEGTDGVPIVYAYLGLTRAALCELDGAEKALDEARREGESRETLLGAQEVALRRGALDEVSAFLQNAAAMPGAADDAWLGALRAGLREKVPCPPPEPHR